MLSRGKKTPESAFKGSEDNTRRAIDTPLLLRLEDGFVKPTFQSVGEKAMRSAKTVSSFFAENLGEKPSYFGCKATTKENERRSIRNEPGYFRNYAAV